jgi:hypothetical protein
VSDVVGWLVFGAFVALIVSFFCTENLLARFVARNRLRVNESSRLSSVLLANLVSLEIVWIGGCAFVWASGADLYAAVLLGSICIQAIWLFRQLWLFHRDHLRMAGDRPAAPRMRGPVRS